MSNEPYDLTPTDAEAEELRVVPLEVEEPSYEEQLRNRYREIVRDKRHYLDLDCPMWTNHCNCPELVPHRNKQGRPWCAPCQKAHEAPAHAMITEEQFVKRFLPPEEGENG